MKESHKKVAGKVTVVDDFCADNSQHSAQVILKFQNANKNVKRCFVCRKRFDKSHVRILACAYYTHWLFFDKYLGTRQPQNVYAHLKCTKHDSHKAINICSYIDGLLLIAESRRKKEWQGNMLRWAAKPPSHPSAHCSVWSMYGCGVIPYPFPIQSNFEHFMKSCNY